MNKAMTYPVTIYQRDIFILRQPDLGIVVEGERLEEVFQNYLEQEQQLRRTYAKLGESLPEPEDGSKHGQRSTDKRTVYKKVMLWSIAILLPTVLLSSALREMPRLAAHHFPKALQLTMDSARVGVETFVKRLNNMTPESREEFRHDLEVIANNMAPFSQALSPLLCRMPYDNNRNQTGENSVQHDRNDQPENYTN